MSDARPGGRARTTSPASSARATAIRSRCSARTSIGGIAVVRAFVPSAETVEVLADGSDKRLGALDRRHATGSSRVLVGITVGAPYRLRARNAGGTWTLRDPYAFGPVLGPLDDHLLVEGTHRELYERLGAHLMRPRRVRPGCISPSGRRMRVASPSWATSTPGTAGGIRCASASTAACGRSSRPTSARARSTNTRSSDRTARCSR